MCARARVRVFVYVCVCVVFILRLKMVAAAARRAERSVRGRVLHTHCGSVRARGLCAPGKTVRVMRADDNGGGGSDSGGGRSFRARARAHMLPQPG